MLGCRLVGKAECVQRAVKPVAAAISGKHPSGAITTIGGRGKSDDQKPRLRVTEPGERLCPIFHAMMPARWSLSAGFTPANQPGTPPALHHSRIQFIKPFCEIVDDHSSTQNISFLSHHAQNWYGVRALRRAVPDKRGTSSNHARPPSRRSTTLLFFPLITDSCVSSLAPLDLLR
jgi:hypothetical protein